MLFQFHKEKKGSDNLMVLKRLDQFKTNSKLQ